MIAAAVLLGIAALVVFVIHPGASQGQVGWYAALLPGSIVGAMPVSVVQNHMPQAQSIVYLLSLVVFSFLWYLAMALVVTKIVRAFVLARKV